MKKNKFENLIARKRKTNGIFIVSIILLLLLILYDRFVLTPVRQTDFQVSPVTVFCGYVGKPLFWLLIGIVVSSLIPWNRQGKRLLKILPICGSIIIIIYAGMVIFHIFLDGNYMPDIFRQILSDLLDIPVLFLIPGILMGIYTANIK